MTRFNRSPLCLALVLMSAAGLTACGESGSGSNTLVPVPVVNPPAMTKPYSIAVFGDMPYGADQVEFQATPGFLNNINNDPSIFLAMHGGDIHSGSEACTENYNRSVYSLIGGLKMPLVYTPGDNEWQDCTKAKQFGGAYNSKTGQIDYVLDKNGVPVNYAKGDPIQNLQLVRNIFFAQPGVPLGLPGTLTLNSQAKDGATASDRQYVENVWFMRGTTLFVTVNIPGGSNNGTDPWYGAPNMSQAQKDEVSARTTATVNWLNTAFDQAKTKGANSVVILTQADLWDTSKSDLSGYKPYVDTIANRTREFAKPVLLLNGDSHAFRSDNPLMAASPCVLEPVDAKDNTTGAAAMACPDDAYSKQPYNYNVSNFHRVIFHGSTLPLEWLKLNVDPAQNANQSAYAYGPFSWSRVIVK